MMPRSFGADDVEAVVIQKPWLGGVEEASGYDKARENYLRKSHG